MKTVAKVTAAIVMVLSTVLFIAIVAGVFGTWWVRGEAVQVVTNLTAVAGSSLERTQALVEQVGGQLERSQTAIDDLTTGIEKAGATVEETNLALAAAEALFDTDLTPAVEQLTERLADVRDTVSVIDQTLALMSSLPFARDSRLLEIADAAIEKTKAIGATLTEIRQTIKTAKANATQDVVTTLTAPLGRASAKLATIGGDLAQLGQRIDTAQAELPVLRDRINDTITFAAIVLTLALIWMALAQIGLFVHAYGVFTGRDPLARWHKGDGDEHKTAPAVAQVTNGVA